MIKRSWQLFRDQRTAGAAPRGQIIVMFAMFLTSLLGAVGLATDLGFAYAEKRTTQNAADAAALAGARQVARYTKSAQTSAWAEAERYALNSNNRVGTTDQDLVTCEYVGYGGGDDDDDDDDDDDGGAGCHGIVPSWATGVRVEVKETHPTFFIRILPGAPNSVTTRAGATAHVQQLSKAPAGPFIVCGDAAWAIRNLAGPLASDQSVSNLTSNNKIDRDYVGWTFRVMDNKISQGEKNDPAYKAGCRTKDAASGSDFNGMSKDAGAANRGKATPGWFAYDIPLRLRHGPPARQAEPATNQDDLWVVTYAAFFVEFQKSGGENSYNGRLLDDYIVSGPGEETWCRDCGGAVVVRLSD